jgi:ubiquinone/menaquinone biosynthesis C-methylase UbiE
VIRPEDYARWRASPVGLLTDRLELEVVFGLAGDLHGRRVLDVGCGDGAQSVVACQRGARVTGVDTSPAMLEAARRRAEIDCPGTIGWCQASAERLPFESKVFDAVITVTALCFVKDPQRAVLEAARVLRPGGRLIIGELGMYSLWALSRRLRGWLGSATWRKARFWTMGSLRRLIEQAGLRFHSRRGCVYYPPIEVAARLMVKADCLLSHLGSVGAAFLAVRADKV